MKQNKFKRNVSDALNNPKLKVAIRRTTDRADAKRATAVKNFPGFDRTREQGQKIKDHVIEYLDYYLAEFERNAIANGSIVHWAKNAEHASQIVVDICHEQGAKKITRSKSMLGEEIGLPAALDREDFERVETDLAEHIIQLAGDPPSHIVWPALHLTREDVVDLFRENHQNPIESTQVVDLVSSARRELRHHFLSADVGITGANFLVADTGQVCTVTNEGNAELTTTPPKVHIVTAGIEKLVPSIAHAMPLLRLLVRSATGADITQYTTFHNGPKRGTDLDGPEHCHIVLVDNGRTNMLKDDMKEMLRCIRCGACMNHCVVYKHIGGHAYGSVYPGPMGAVITPNIDGLNNAFEPVSACTLNGKCQEVCPVNIPLPTLIRAWRKKAWEKKVDTIRNRFLVACFSQLAQRPRLFQFTTNMAILMMKPFSRRGWIRWMPFAGSWTTNRDLLAPQGQSFIQQYQKNRERHEA